MVSFPTGEYLGVPTNDYYYLAIIYRTSAPQLGSDITRQGLPGGWITHPDYVSPPMQGGSTVNYVTFAMFSRVGNFLDSEVQLPTQSKTVGGVVTTIPVLGGVYMLVKVPDITATDTAVLGGTVAFTSSAVVGDFQALSGYSFTTGGGRVVVFGVAYDIDILDWEESASAGTPLAPLKLWFSYVPEEQTIATGTGKGYYGATSTSVEVPGRFSGAVLVRGRRLVVDTATVGPALPERESVAASPGPVRLHRF